MFLDPQRICGIAHKQSCVPSSFFCKIYTAYLIYTQNWGLLATLPMKYFLFFLISLPIYILNSNLTLLTPNFSSLSLCTVSSLSCNLQFSLPSMHVVLCRCFIRLYKLFFLNLQLYCSLPSILLAVFRIGDILVRIQVCGYVPLTNGYSTGSCSFCQWLSRRQKSFFFFKFFCLISFWRHIYIIFPR